MIARWKIDQDWFNSFFLSQFQTVHFQIFTFFITAVYFVNYKNPPFGIRGVIIWFSKWTGRWGIPAAVFYRFLSHDIWRLQLAKVSSGEINKVPITRIFIVTSWKQMTSQCQSTANRFRRFSDTLPALCFFCFLTFWWCRTCTVIRARRAATNFSSSSASCWCTLSTLPSSIRGWGDAGLVCSLGTISRS